uniref:TIM-barrel domain-containing protein n=1 Tax=Desertifilum tharense IPPAS B-1220 TaxID=1781255 RepID=A0ACD5GQD0_9CYAN
MRTRPCGISVPFVVATYRPPYKPVSNNGSISPGILSASGYSALNDSQSALIQEGKLTQRPESDTQDWYFFAYGYDYTQGLKDFVQLCGSIPMLPRWAFGVWFSLYDQMSDRSYQALCDRFTELELPLEVLLLDVDWHRSGWCGWDWNRELFPEPSQFLQWAHDSGLHIGANVHVDGVSPEESQFLALCKARNLDPQKSKAAKPFPSKTLPAVGFSTLGTPKTNKAIPPT